MHRRLLPDILIAVSVAALLLAASFDGLPGELGAHPFWALQTGAIGGTAGAGLWFGLNRAGVSAQEQVLLAAVALLASGAAAYFGKQVFAASFAENAVAGRFWYFGWFGISGSFAVCLGAAGRVLILR